MKKTKRIKIWTFMLLASFVVVVPILVVSIRLSSYGALQRETFELVLSISAQCPVDEDEKLWKRGTGWIVTAYGNICCSESLVSRRELVCFSDDLRAKLDEAPPDRSTVEWIWKRLGRTGAHGAFYIDKYDTSFRQSWD